MEKREVFVPLISWLIGGSRIGGSYNVYTGSVGTDPLKGAIGQRIFNYRIGIEKNESDEEFIRVSTYEGMICYENCSEDAVENNLFEATESGVGQIKEYLEKKAEEFFLQG